MHIISFLQQWIYRRKTAWMKWAKGANCRKYVKKSGGLAAGHY
ncbi:hypothetical protein [Dickeya chrysanthemi]|uniref:Uncharacterized protein n=1 Tax=Dickeya chrysanthemi TaxID=556 RepID=A0ABU8JPT5_DICCH